MTHKRQEIINELKHLAPKLAQIKIETEQSVPKDYFDSLKIDSLPIKADARVRLFYWTSSIAAAVALLLIATFVYQNNSGDQLDDAISELDFDYYIEDNIDLLEESDLVSLLEDDLNLDILTEINEEYLDEYLDFNQDQFSDSDLSKIY